MSDALAPIPTPRAQWMRQLRHQHLPVVVFALGVVAAVVLWTRWVAPPTFIAEVETTRTELRPVQPGIIKDLKVGLLQNVKAGDILAHVVTQPPQVLESSLAVTRAEIQMMRATLDPVTGQQRTALDMERLKLDWMSKRVELAAIQGQLVQAEATLNRSADLHEKKMITEQQFEEAKNLRNALAAQLKAQTDLITQLEPGIRALSPPGTKGTPTAAQGLNAAVRQKEEELRLLEAQLGPVPLRAPIDGVVTLVYRQNGEMVGAAEPILQITSTRIERLVGFIRQPVQLPPTAGVAVEVRTRTQLRQRAESTIAQVGNQMEPIPATLLAAMRLPVSNTVTEYGLRIHVTPPPELMLRPGEQVDIIVRH